MIDRELIDTVAEKLRQVTDTAQNPDISAVAAVAGEQIVATVIGFVREHGKDMNVLQAMILLNAVVTLLATLDALGRTAAERAAILARDEAEQFAEEVEAPARMN